MTHIQSVLFDRNYYNVNSAEKWLKANHFKTNFYGKPVHITNQYLRYRQYNPEEFNRFRIKHTNEHISFIIGFN